MKNNSLVAGLLSLCFAVTSNAQSISSARNAAPSNCDTGCAQSTLTSVSGNNAGSTGWNVVFQGNVKIIKSFTVTKQAMVMLNVQGGQFASISLKQSNGVEVDGCTGTASQNATAAQINNAGSSYVSGSCIIPPGTYTATSPNGYLYVAELPD